MTSFFSHQPNPICGRSVNSTFRNHNYNLEKKGLGNLIIYDCFSKDLPSILTALGNVNDI